MVRPTIKKNIDNLYVLWPQVRFHKFPLAYRRLGAAIAEVSLVAVSALIPHALGAYVQSQFKNDLVPLNPVVGNTHEAIAKTLALPMRENYRQVPPLTNLLWSTALITPILVASWQVYLLGKKGQTLPKQWFGVRVVNAAGRPPGLIRAVFRESVARCGLPATTAYAIWRYTGAFPDGGILLTLLGLVLLAENAIALFRNQRRTFHDQMSGTYVLDAERNLTSSNQSSPPRHQGPPVRVEVQSTWADPDPESSSSRRRETVTTVILTSLPRLRPLNLWHWMREHPGTTLLIVAFAGMASVLGTFVGTQIYIQSQANQRIFNQQNNDLFLGLVKQLKSSSENSIEGRRAALLAMARLEDPRAIPFLVDWLNQEKTTEVIDAVWQALGNKGPSALPHLQRLNQSLRNDREIMQRRGIKEQELIAQKLRATQSAIARILNLDSGKTHNANLNRTDLGANDSDTAPFTLILDKSDLSGINFKGAILAKASLRESRFYGPGDDERSGTFDDWIANLSGAELKEANLNNALLSRVELIRANLTRANLKGANLNAANLTGANLSSTQLVSANLQEAVLENASLTGSDLGNANFSKSNLQGARLGQVSAIGTQFQLANLSQSTWQNADLTAANLRQANLKDADLSSTKLIGANLRQAKLQNANLSYADLSNADLREANVE